MRTTAKAGGRHRRKSSDQSISLLKRTKHFVGRALVLFTAGLLIATTATLRPPAGSRYDSDLLSLVARKEATVKALSDENDGMSTQIEQMIAQVPDQPQMELADRTRIDFEGPGVVVTLKDAPVLEPLPDGVKADDLVIHQQDIESVFNALRSGGAEVISVQGHFVGADSKVSCVGNVINIDGKLYSPPYEIAAIGSSERLRATLAADPQIAIIGEYVARFNLGYSVRDEANIQVRATSQQPVFNFAKVAGNDSN